MFACSILGNPHEQKYHTINISKFFAPITGGGPPVDGGTALFVMFGFEVDLAGGVFRMPYPKPTDLERLRHRLQDLTRSFQTALQLAATKSAASAAAAPPPRTPIGGPKLG